MTTTAPGVPHRENDFSTQHHVYEPHVVGLPPLRPYLREAWRRRIFARELARTKLRSQHLNTVFGQLWLVLNPLMLAGVYFLLVDILRGGERPPNFFAHLIAGLFAYHFVSTAVREATRSVVSGGRLILNTAFPRVLLPISAVIVAFRRFLPTAVVYIPVHIASGLPAGWHLLWLLPLVATMAVLATGLSMVVAALQVYFRDLKNFIPYLMRVWLYVSPILYFADEMPARYRWLLDVNPLGQTLSAWSDVLIMAQGPSAKALLIGAAWASVIFVAGALFFVSREREFAVRL